MKYFSKLIILLILICYSIFYSQENAKGLSLTVKDVKTVEKNGKTSWIAKTILTNHSNDTLFYFSNTNCETNYYLVGAAEVDSVQLFIDFKKCDSLQQIVIAVPPSGQRIVELEINSVRTVKSSFKLIVYLCSIKAKNKYERIPHYYFTNLQRSKENGLLVVSKRIKIKMHQLVKATK